MKSLTVLAMATLGASAIAQVGIDGIKGSEWNGILADHATYNAAAPTSNFGSPTPFTNAAGYDIYLRSDANYLYGLFVATDNFNTAVGNFANVYFNVSGTGSTAGSNFGIEIGGAGGNAFIPGSPGGFSTVGFFSNAGIFDVAGGNITQEFALDWDYLTTDPQGMGFDKTQVGDEVMLRLSQTFGYSVVGGPTFGADRLGSTTFNPTASAVPGPSALAAFGLGLLGRVRRRRSAK